MSYNRSSKNAPKRYRGASRPIDPRRVPGQPQRRRFDTTGLFLVGGMVVLVLAFIVWLSVSQGNAATTTTTGTTSSDPAAQATQAEVAFLTQTADLPRISAADAKNVVNTPDTKFIDVRTADVYAQSHIPGAQNIPYTDAKNKLAEFSKTGTLILYCQ